MKIELLAARYKKMIGLARYSTCLQEHLAGLGIDFRVVEPGWPLPIRLAHEALKPFGYDLKQFFSTYPLSAPLNGSTVKHFTTQMMASLYTFQPGLERVAITVHDLVPYLMRNDPEQNTYRHRWERAADNLAMQNLRRADRLIAVSAYTKRMLVEKIGCAPGRIQVVYNGLDHTLFKPQAIPGGFRARYGLDPATRYLLYVGSENPRKNLQRLIQAFAMVKRQIPNLRLVQVGSIESPARLRALESTVKELGLEEAIIFHREIPQEDLVRFYCAADLFVFPSLYEGFGLPPLEAMACGTPVVCSNATSLPEVVGEAGILVDPEDVEGLAEAVLRVLTDPGLAEGLRRRGLERASEFTWERTARETAAVYRQVCEL